MYKTKLVVIINLVFHNQKALRLILAPRQNYDVNMGSEFRSV